MARAIDPPAPGSSDLIEAGEKAMQVLLDEAVRSYLTLVRREALARVNAGHPLTAAGSSAPRRDPRDPLTQGQFAGWWARIVDAMVVEGIRTAWQVLYRKVAGGQVTATSLDAAKGYLARVRDRLVRGITPPIYEDSFDKVRVAVAESLASGWSKKDLAQRLARELGWEKDGPYWRAQLDRYNTAIDQILDPLGKPGTPAREYARLHDPDVRRLQGYRSHAVEELDRERAYWQTRATRIARTEATGASNFAALRALQDEGWTHKQWLATNDSRTRPDHLAAQGQTVLIDSPFSIGGFSLMIPGDPSAPAGEVINCRCTIIGSDGPQAEE